MLAFCKRVCNFFQHCETSVASFFFSEIEGAFCNPTSTSSHLKVSLDSLAFDTYHLSPSSIKPTPFKTNIDYYRGKTKSIYEKEPIFRDFARNIPLSQSLDDSSSLHELKRDFQRLVSARDPVLGRPDPLKPSAVGAIVCQFTICPESVLFRINLLCSGAKPALPAEKRNAFCAS